MPDLSLTRCFHHEEREAAARCPGCHRFFCRECVIEHEGRLMCSGCLRKLTAQAGRRARSVSRFLAACCLLAGLAATWAFFFLMGLALLRIPSSFHEGTVWTGDAKAAADAEAKE